MANTTITALTSLASADVADEDVFVVDDITENETKKITFANLAAAIDTTQLANVLVLQSNVVQLTANIDLVQDNVAALPDSAANDFITYTRLNANIDVVQDNVASITSRSDAFGTYANTNLDTKANVSATYFLALSNDFVTYTRLNANIDVVQDNVSALPDTAANDFVTYTRLNANINVVQDNVAGILDGTTFTGDVILNAQSDLRFADADSSNYVAFQAPATVSSNITWTLPDADGSAGQFIKTDGSGTLSFVTVVSDPDPSVSLGSDTDCGTAVTATDTQDAFGVAIDSAFVEFDLRTQPSNSLGITDLGALT